MHFALPAGDRHVRVDSGVRPGDEITVHYDPMLAKVVVWDVDREQARRRLVDALGRVEIVGITSNVSFLRALAAHPAFAAEEVDTGFIERHHDSLFAPVALDAERVLAAGVGSLVLHQQEAARRAAAASGDPYSPWYAMDGWRLNLEARREFRFRLGGAERLVTVHYGRDGLALDFGAEVEPAEFIALGTEGRLRITLDGTAYAFRFARGGPACPRG